MTKSPAFAGLFRQAETLSIDNVFFIYVRRDEFYINYSIVNFKFALGHKTLKMIKSFAQVAC